MGMVYISDNLHHGNWRVLVFVSVLPAYIGLIISVIYLEESARYLNPYDN
jgi:hypothetical protein